jgi:hypothetical protein
VVVNGARLITSMQEMHVHSFDILELQGRRSFRMTSIKNASTNLVYYAYNDKFVRQSFLYGKLHVNLYHI